jgi:ATP-dependent Lon protease
LEHPKRLDAPALRWRFDESLLDFKDTSEVHPAVGIIGQPVAIEAMRFGIECDAPGQNIYVRGVTGTGRMTLVQSVLAELDPRPRRRLDRCYVHNFSQPDRPRLVTLPAGDGPKFRRAMRQAAEFIGHRLGEVLETASAKSHREALQEQAQQAVLAISNPLEQELAANGLMLVNQQTGPVARPVIFPLRDGEPLAPDEFRKLVAAGAINEQEAERLETLIRQYSKRLEEVTREVSTAWQAGLESLQQFVQQEVRAVLQQLLDPVRKQFPVPAVGIYLDEVIADVLEQRLPGAVADNLPEAVEIYGVNVVSSHEDARAGAVITENTPSVANLLGSVEPDFVNAGQLVANYRGIRAGALVRADGGFLVLDARDVLMEPGAWRMLMRAMRTRSVEIVPPEAGWPMPSMSIKPEPIDIQVRVILLGSSGLYYQLDQVDQDFSDLFKVLADFDSEIERSTEGVRQYAGVVARVCQDEQLPHFSASGVAALAEHGARIAARAGRITARFGRQADINR